MLCWNIICLKIFDGSVNCGVAEKRVRIGLTNKNKQQEDGIGRSNLKATKRSACRMRLASGSPQIRYHDHGMSLANSRPITATMVVAEDAAAPINVPRDCLQ